MSSLEDLPLSFNEWMFVLFILQLTGIVFLALGLYIKLQKHTYISLLGSSTFPLATYLLLGTGAFIVLSGIIGCTGTCIENRCFMVMVSKFFCFWAHLDIGDSNVDVYVTPLLIGWHQIFADINYRIDVSKQFAHAETIYPVNLKCNFCFKLSKYALEWR